MPPSRLPGLHTFVIDPGVKCKCGNHATHLVEIHAIDVCTTDAPTLTEFMCNCCLTKLYALVATLLEPAPSGVNWCSSCMKPFNNLSDIVLLLEPIG